MRRLAHNPPRATAGSSSSAEPGDIRGTYAERGRPAKCLPTSTKKNPRGLTLVELLVVLVILVIVTAAAIPMMAPAIESRRLREATRGVSSYIMSARSRSIQINRPVGIWIERFSGTDGTVIERGAAAVLFQAEVPPPFSGFTTTSIAEVFINPILAPASVPVVTAPAAGTTRPAKIQPQIVDGLVVGFTVTDGGEGYDSTSPPVVEFDGTQVPFSAIAQVEDDHVARVLPLVNVIVAESEASLMLPGDRIQFNLQGPKYVIHTVSGTKLLVAFSGQGGAFTWPVDPESDSVPYTVFRQPSRSAAAPYQLPEGIVIDLTGSGVGVDIVSNDFTFGDDNDEPIKIMFAPNGTLDRIYRWKGGLYTIERFNATVHLLIGRRERLPEVVPYSTTDSAELQIEKHNWKDLESRWVSIGHQTGAVSTSENAFVVDDLPDSDFPGNIDEKVRQGKAQARRFAREMRGMGGR